MIFRETTLPGVFEIVLEPMRDERGFFARSWCKAECEAHGLDSDIVQCNISHSARRGTLRGMHYQAPPHAEVKIVRCTKGSIYDVVLDLRRDSPTFKKWTAVELSALRRNQLYVPKGFAHGFLTLEDETEVFYQMSASYHADSGRGVRWNDPAFRISWPGDIGIISERDRSYPDFI